MNQKEIHSALVKIFLKISTHQKYALLDGNVYMHNMFHELPIELLSFVLCYRRPMARKVVFAIIRVST